MSLSEQQIRDLAATEVWSKQEVRPGIPDGEETIHTAYLEDGEFFAFAGVQFNLPSGQRPAVQKANLERIIACVNACTGMPTAMLQEHGSVIELYHALLYARRFLDFDATDTPHIDIDQVLSKFTPRIPDGQNPFRERADGARKLLSDLNIQDDTTPMYDVQDQVQAEARPMGLVDHLNDYRYNDTRTVIGVVTKVEDPFITVALLPDVIDQVYPMQVIEIPPTPVDPGVAEAVEAFHTQSPSPSTTVDTFNENPYLDEGYIKSIYKEPTL